MDAREFWFYTYGEVIGTIQIYTRREEMRTKQDAASLYLLADLIGRSTSRFINSKNKLPEIGEVFPGMFDEAGEQSNWAGIRKRMQSYAAAKEMTREASSGNDG